MILITLIAIHPYSLFQELETIFGVTLDGICDITNAIVYLPFFFICQKYFILTRRCFSALFIPLIHLELHFCGLIYFNLCQKLRMLFSFNDRMSLFLYIWIWYWGQFIPFLKKFRPFFLQIGLALLYCECNCLFCLFIFPSLYSFSRHFIPTGRCLSSLFIFVKHLLLRVSAS